VTRIGLKRFSPFLAWLGIGTAIVGCNSTPPETPAMVHELAGGALRVRIVAHTVSTPIESVACWTYLTDGLALLGQKELALTLARAPGETAPPLDALQFFEAVWLQAKAGRTVDVGDFTKMRQGGLLGRSDFQGVIYLPAQDWIGVTYAGPTLQAVVLTGDEVDAAMNYGALRILGELGWAHRAFPTAIWVDRTRPPLRTPEATQRDSLIAKTPTFRAPGLFVKQFARRLAATVVPQARVPGDTAVDFVEPEVVLSLPVSTATALNDALQQLSDEKPFTLVASVDPSSRASFVWVPGKRAPEVIGFAGHGERQISLDALTLIPMPDASSSGTMFEDSAGFTLGKRDWENVRDALRAGRPARVATTGYFSALRIEWRQERGAEPQPGPVPTRSPTPYPSECVSPTFKPDVPVHRCGTLVPYTNEAMASHMSSVNSLADFMNVIDFEVGGFAYSHLDLLKGQGLSLFLSMHPEHKARFWPEFRPGVSPDLVAELENRLAQIEVPKVSETPMIFGLFYILWGTPKTDGDCLVASPKAWQSVIGDRQLQTDELATALWKEAPRSLQ
jgi:hypothetical protein